MSPRHTRLPRQLKAGERRAAAPGAALDALLISRDPREWIGIDLASGAYVRLPHPGEEAPSGARPGRSVVRLTLGPTEQPGDPARPEAVTTEGALELRPPPRRRAVRRLLGRLTKADKPGATLLGSHGPSIAYVDLDNEASSLVLVRTGRALETVVGPTGEPLCTITFGGTTQSLPLLDPPLRRATVSSSPRPLTGAALEAALGYRPGYLLIGLDAVEGGHVRKVVLAVLER